MANLGDVGTARVTVELDFENAAREVQEAEQRMEPLHAKVELDQQQVTREVKQKIEAVERTAGTVDLDAELDQAQVTAEVKAKATVAGKQSGGVPVGLDVNESQAIAAVRASLRKVAAAVGSIPIRINTKALAAQGALAGAAFRKGFTKTIAGTGQIAAASLIPLGAAVAGIGFALKQGADDAKVLDNALVSLRGALKLGGKETGITARMVRDLASSMEGLTSISEESLITAQGQMIRFGAVTRKNLPRVTRLLADTAVGMRQVNEQGEIAPGFLNKFTRALKDPTKGLALLARSGVPVSKSQQELVKRLQETGRTAEATEVVMKLLGRRFEGESKRLGTSIGGRFRLAVDDVQDAVRDLTKKILPTIAPIIQQVSRDIAATINGNQQQIASFVGGLVRGIGAIVKFVTTSKGFHDTLKGIAAVFVGVAAGIKGFGEEFAKAFSEGRSGEAKSFGELMKDLGESLGKLARDVLPPLGRELGKLAGWFSEHRTTLKLFIGALAVGKIFGFANALGFLLKWGLLPLARFGWFALTSSIGALVTAMGGITVAGVGAALTAVAGAAGAALAAVAPLAAAVGIVAGAFYLAWTNSELFRKGCQLISDAALNAVPGLRTLTEASADLALSLMDLGPVVDFADTKLGKMTKAEQREHWRKLRGEVKGTATAVEQTGTAAQNARAKATGFGAFYSQELNKAGAAADRNKPKVANFAGSVTQGIKTALGKAIQLGQRLAKTAASVIREVGQGIQVSLRSKTISAARAAIANVSGVFRRFAENLGKVVQAMAAYGVHATIFQLRIVMLGGAFKRLITTMLTAVTVLRGQLVAAFRDAINRIRSAVMGASLYRAGLHMMGTFLLGLRAGFTQVQSFIRGIAAWIRANKGPISADKKLLYPAGQAIMGGFERGLRAKWSPVQRWVQNIGSFFKGAVPGQAMFPVMADIMLGTGGIGDLNKVLAGKLGIPAGFLANGPLGFLHPTSGWADTLSQVRILEKAFSVGMTSGLRFADTVAGPGVSQHTLGQAADFGTSRASFAALDNLATFTSRLVGSIFKQVIWKNSLWVGGSGGHGFVGNHMDHVHLGWQGRAAGGQVRKDRMYQWNERGREMFMPQQNGYVMNAGRTKELVSALKSIAQQKSQGPSSTSNSIQGGVHFHQSGADPKQVVRELGMVFSRA